jgi:hypothetical protein
MDIYPHVFFFFLWHAWMCNFVYLYVSQDADTLFAKSATRDHKLLCQELVTRSKQANIGCVFCMLVYGCVCVRARVLVCAFVFVSK